MGKLGISVKDAHQDANSTMSWLVNNVFFPGGMMNTLTGGKYKNLKKGDAGGVARDDFPSPSQVARGRDFIGRGGLMQMRNHSFLNEKTLHADEGGLAAATGTPNERGYWLEDEDRAREYNNGPIQSATHGGRVARMEGRRSRHEPVLLLPGEVVLTEKQAASARRAGAKLPTHSLQKRAGKL